MDLLLQVYFSIFFDVLNLSQMQASFPFEFKLILLPNVDYAFLKSQNLHVEMLHIV